MFKKRKKVEKQGEFAAVKQYVTPRRPPFSVCFASPAWSVSLLIKLCAFIPLSFSPCLLIPHLSFCGEKTDLIHTELNRKVVW